MPDLASVGGESDIGALLEKRALLYSAPPQQERRVDAALVLVVKVGGELYGIKALDIQEVYRPEGLTRVPGASSAWAGVMNLRGALCPVVDLATYLGIEGETQNDRPVLVTSSDQSAGLLVDEVIELRSITPEEIQPVPERGSAMHRDAVSGTTSDLVSLVEVSILLGDPVLALDETSWEES